MIRSGLLRGPINQQTTSHLINAKANELDVEAAAQLFASSQGDGITPGRHSWAVYFCKWASFLSWIDSWMYISMINCCAMCRQPFRALLYFHLAKELGFVVILSTWSFRHGQLTCLILIVGGDDAHTVNERTFSVLAKGFSRALQPMSTLWVLEEV